VEHSILHALQLLGLLMAVAGTVLVLGLVQPAARAAGNGTDAGILARDIAASAALWTARGALVSAVSTVLDIVAQTAELDNTTILGGVDVREATRFALTTAV
jgi:hypothetical protein